MLTRSPALLDVAEAAEPADAPADAAARETIGPRTTFFGLVDAAGRWLAWPVGFERWVGQPDAATAWLLSELLAPLHARDARRFDAAIGGEPCDKLVCTWRDGGDRGARIELTLSRRDALVPRTCTLVVRPRASLASVAARMVADAEFGMCAFDLSNGETLIVNATAHRLAGVSTDEGVLPAIEAIVGAALSACIGQSGIAHCAAVDTWVAWRVTGLDATGGSAIVQVTLRVADDGAESERFRRFHDDQLLKTSRLLSVGEMASMLAHELNQPLGTINNYLSGLIRRLDGQSLASVREVLKPIETARAQAEHASRIIARMREFVRMREPRFEPEAADALVQRVFGLVELEAARHRVLLRASIAPGLPALRADRVLIEQVLVNLVRNAVEAIRGTRNDERIVDVGAEPTEYGDIRITVADSGPGLTEDEQRDVFSPFFTTKPDGMGLGLSICRSIVELHGGNLAVTRSDSGGAAFWFTVPAASEYEER